MIFIAGIAISVFLSALLLVKKNKSTADQILLAWFILIAIHQFYYNFYTSGNFRLYSSLIALDMPFPLMHGPFLFLYASALVDRLPKNKFLWFVHFIPAAICFGYIIPFMYSSSETKIFVMEHNGIGYATFMGIRSVAIILSGIAYVTATLILLRKHRRIIMDRFSDIEKINLKWLQYLTYGLGVIWIPVIFGNDFWVFFCVVIFVAVIGFFGIRQTPVFTSTNHPDKNFPPGNLVKPNSNSDRLIIKEVDHNYEPENFSRNQTLESILAKAEISVSKEVGRKYETSGLTAAKKVEIAEGLTKNIDGEKLFLNPELSLDMLAATLRIHPNYLSQFINEEMDMTFYDYINSKRVMEFKRLLNLPEKSHFNMLGLALECGFNSKSSFNRNFKKFSGQTPSEYLSVTAQ
jgi:AraC-like DNA-binding protein